MQTVVGRLTANATINETTDGRKVVNFSIVENDRFKSKGSDEFRQMSTFYNCSYWISTGVAPALTKGSLIEVSGRIGINAWTNAAGEAKASLTLHTQYIKLHGKAKERNSKAGDPTKSDNPSAHTANEDLPF